jgi:hypothetical protein
MDFIKADESAFIIRFFRTYSKWLIRKRFKRILIRKDYEPGPESRSVYFLNHSMWWDGLIPLLLNEYHFRQKARALMEDKQMREYGFFRKIGAFSINLQDPRQSLISLRYAVESMKREHSCLFIYPEGALVPFSTQKPIFKEGLAWLRQQLPAEEVDFVPIALCPNFYESSKPDLYIRIGKKSEASTEWSRTELIRHFEEELHEQILSCVKESSDNREDYHPFF